MSKIKKLCFLTLICLMGLSFVVHKSLAQSENSSKKKAIYFYQETCIHCQAVDEYFKQNEIYEKYDIRKMEISGAYNLSYFNNFFDAFGIPSEKRGWPAVFFGQKFLVGDRPIQENFINEIEKANASQFPNPEEIKKSRLSSGTSFSEPVASSFKISLPIVLGAALADSVSPCILVIFVILASIIIFGNPENKKEISIFGSFFLLTIFSTYFVFGIGIFGSEEIFKLAGFFSVLLGVAVLFSGIFVLRRYWKKWKMMEGFESEIKKIVPRKFKEAFTVVWIFIKRNIQRMNLSIAAILIGFASSGFLFPCIEKPYGIFVNSLASKDKIIESILTVALYNLIFIIPTLIFSGIIYWFAHTQKLEIFRTKHDKLIRIIVGIGLLFAGSYFIYSNCF